MTSARDEILERVGAPRGATTYVGTTGAHRGPQGLGDCGLFSDRLEDYKALVTRVSEAQVIQCISAALARRGAGSILVPEGFPAQWLSDFSVELVRDDGSLSPGDLDKIDGVLTSCSVAIAETGTIVLTHGSGQGRRALTLIPDYHLVIVEERQVVASVPDAIAALDPTLPMTWISGPSATSDIELQRVEGVHGPRTLEVLIVAGS